MRWCLRRNKELGPHLGAEWRWANNFELRLAQKGREKAEEKF
jgi:hypothetical protein